MNKGCVLGNPKAPKEDKFAVMALGMGYPVYRLCWKLAGKQIAGNKYEKILIGYLIDGKNSGIDNYILNIIDQIKNDNVKIDCLTNHIDNELKADQINQELDFWKYRL